MAIGLGGMRPPRFARDEIELAALSRQTKTWACPHCQQTGQVNRHGWLRGLAAAGPGKTAVRGRRFFCSNRGRRRGCGRTFSVRFATVLAGATVRTGTLWRFLVARFGGASVLGAWTQAGSGFSLEATYRWWRRWRRGENPMRTRLWRGREPPSGVAAALEQAYGSTDPIAGFQGREQAGFPGFAS